MAAHSQTSPAIPPVVPDQPLSAWPQWLRDIAQAINLAGTSLTDLRARVEALEAAARTPPE